MTHRHEHDALFRESQQRYPVITAHLARAEHWANAYVGLPWQEKGDTRDGVSCWGLCQIVYRELAGIVLPSYGDRFACSAEQAEVQAIIRGATSGPTWAPVALEDASEFDVAVFAVAGLDAHVGLVCGPGRMLHITHGQDSAIVDYRSGRWSHRLSGIYRHADLARFACGGIVSGNPLRIGESILTNHTPVPLSVQRRIGQNGMPRVEVTIGVDRDA